MYSVARKLYSTFCLFIFNSPSFESGQAVVVGLCTKYCEEGKKQKIGSELNIIVRYDWTNYFIKTVHPIVFVKSQKI